MEYFDRGAVVGPLPGASALGPIDFLDNEGNGRKIASGIIAGSARNCAVAYWPEESAEVLREETRLAFVPWRLPARQSALTSASALSSGKASVAPS